jgi:hypothetical protein
VSDPVFSPDGKWMWTGSEWIPAPPSKESVQEKPIFSYSDWEKKKISKKQKYVEIVLKYLQNEKGEPISKEEIQEWMNNHYKQWIRDKGMIKKMTQFGGREWRASRQNESTFLWNNYSSEVKIQLVDSDYEFYSNLVISFYKPSNIVGELKNMYGLDGSIKKIQAFNKENKDRKKRRAYAISLKGNNNWDGKEATIKKYPNSQEKTWFYNNITRYWWDRAPPIQTKGFPENAPVASTTGSEQYLDNGSSEQSSWLKRQTMLANMRVHGIRKCKKCGHRDDNALFCPICNGRMIG